MSRRTLSYLLITSALLLVLVGALAFGVPWGRDPLAVAMVLGAYVLAGTERAMEETFGSTCHGAGRTMSRHQAKRSVQGPALRQKLEAEGIRIRAGSMGGLAEEAPAAYKDVDRVVTVVHGAGLARRVARLTPLAVIKG